MDSSLIGDRTKFAYIDSVCDRFETAWKKGPPPLLENFLANASKQVSPELFRALLELEIDYRRKNNLPISKQDYLSRFPQFVNHIDHLFPSHDSQQTYSQQTEGDDLGSTDTPGNSPLSLPMSLGRYELQNEIARGGMGGVFLAKDLKFSRTLAVKVLLPPRDHTAKVKERFLEETQLMGQLQHPGIPPVHDQGELPDGRPYFCMKLIKGQTLSKLLKERANATAEKPRFLDIFQQICQTVAYTHSRNIIHRDLKPSNIMVGAFGEVQVMDWGLAKKKRPPPEAGTSTKSETLPQSTIYSLRSKPDSGESTQAGQVLGTPAYMPPEQARGEVELLDERSDVFGLGAILCEILTSLPPFAGTSALENHRQSMKGDLSDAFSRLDGCGADNTLIELCRVCLAPNPEDRPADAAEVAEAVAAYQEGVQEKLRQAELQRAQAEVKVSEERKRRRLWFWLTTAAAGLFLSVVVGLAVSTWKWQEAEENFAIAKENEKEAKKQEKEAKKQTKLAIKNELFARNRSYVLSMKEAYGNYNASRMGRVHDLLDAQIP